MVRQKKHRPNLDGEAIPFNLVALILGRIVTAVSAPVSVDFEGDYSSDDDNGLVVNVLRLLDMGVTGLNFEDRIVKGQGIYDITLLTLTPN